MASEEERQIEADSRSCLPKHKHGNKHGKFNGERNSRRVKPQKSYREEDSDEEIRGEDKNFVKARAGKRKDTSSRMMLEKKQRQISETLRWLGENYELKDGKCLPRCVMYTHYLDFCKKNKLCPSGPATFGKIIRQRFPKLTTRRLGTRGQSKYHYYGIGVKETSPYFHAGYSKKGLTRFSGIKGKGEGSNKKFSLSSKSGTLLPEFPEARKLELPDGVSAQKLETFIMMYRTHCQRMLDTVVSANFNGVQNFILHFWQGMPGHIMSVLESPMVVDLVGVCDSILYKVLTDVLIPSTIQDLPDSLREEITSFAANLLEWLDESLAKVPASLREAKLEVARMFTQGLRRQVCFIRLAQTARSVLLSYEAVSKMLTDLRKIDFSNIFSKCFFISERNDIFDKAGMFVQELDELLSKQAPLEAYTEWLDSLVDRCVLQSPAGGNSKTVQERAKDFLAMWSFVTGGVLADLTLRSAPSFGVFHLIHMTFEEYAFLIIESQLMQEMDRNMTLSLQRFVKKEYRSVEPSPVLAVPPESEKLTEKFQEVPRKRRKPEPINLTQISNDPLKELSNRTAACVPHPSILHERFNSTSPAYTKASTPVVYSGTDRAHHHSRLSAPNTPTVSANNIPRTISSGQIAGVSQYSLPDDVIQYQTAVSESASFQNELMNAIDKTLFSNPHTLNANQYAGAPWLNEGSTNPVAVGSMHYTEMHRNSVGFQETQRNSEDFQGIHENPKNFTEMIRTPDNFQGISPTGHQGVRYNNNNNNNNNVSFPFSCTPQGNYTPAIGSYAVGPSITTSLNTSQSRNDWNFPASASTAFPKFNNNFYFDMSRSTGQPTGSDVMGFASFVHTTGSELGIDGITTHEAQLGRVGVGAV